MYTTPKGWFIPRFSLFNLRSPVYRPRTYGR